MNNFVRTCLLLTVSCCLLLAGCAKPVPLRFVWPPPPDKPRVEWVGVYASEANFNKTASQEMLANMLGDQGDYRFKAPFGIATDGAGIVYISDTFDRNIRVYDFNRKKVEFLTKMPVFVAPLGLDVDSRGNLYIADGGARRVIVYDANRNPLMSIESKEQFENPAYVAVNEKLQRIYVSDGKLHHIVVFSLEGEYLFTIGGVGREPGKFYAPQGMAFGPDGNLYVADMFNARVQVLTPDGTFISEFGERGDQAGQFENPKDLAFDSDGHLYVIDSKRSDLNIYTPEGELLLTVGDARPSYGAFGFATPKSVFIDHSDRIYVAESIGRRFAVWQYLSEDYLRHNPYTDEDRQRLIERMRKHQGLTAQ